MHMYANKNDATKTHQIVNRCMIFMIFAAKWSSKSRFEVFGRHGAARCEKMLKKALKFGGECVVRAVIFKHIFRNVRPSTQDDL